VTERSKNLMLMAATVCLMLLLCEPALRLWDRISPLDPRSNPSTPTNVIYLHDTGRYDPRLGWTLKEWVDSPEFHTVEYGIRRNNTTQTGLRAGGILAVGSSFTSGSEVADEQSWPAQLERLIGRPVDNAGVGAYALDQIVLRTEQLLPVARPRVLLVGLMDSVIDWSGYAITAGPKPFFTVARGELITHNIPVPSLDQALPFQPIIKVLSYSLVIDRLMAKTPFGWRWWQARVHNDQVDVSCRLLRRLKQEADRLEIRIILVPEPWATDVMSANVPPPRLGRVMACTSAFGYQTVDTFGAFRAAYEADPAHFKEFYVLKTDGRLTHFSALGNRRVAELVAAALAVEPRPPE
jgi:hypothetical protein